MPERTRWAWAEIDLDAVAHNVGVLRAAAAPAEVWAVVKADGYGHGAVAVGRAALDRRRCGPVRRADGGGRRPARGRDRRPDPRAQRAAARATPADLVAHRLTPRSSTADGIDASPPPSATAAAPRRVHLKVDTGMHRVGAAPDDVAGARRAASPPTRRALRLDGVFTHLAVADEPADPYTGRAARALRRRAGRAARTLDDVAVHAANSAGALAHPDARRSFVRAGIAVYGISPGPGVDELRRRPAPGAVAEGAGVVRQAAGRRRRGCRTGCATPLAADANVATVPIGYADGVRRGLSGNGATC